MQIFYDSDADQNIVKGMNIVIVGYGSQGHAHANNLKDSGANVTVALRKESELSLIHISEPTRPY